MEMREVQSWEELKSPGDYMLTTRCDCGAHGEQSKSGNVAHHYAGCSSPETHTGFVLMCKCGSLFSSHKDHRVLSRAPLTVHASWLCPNGCHAWIRDGVWNRC